MDIVLGGDESSSSKLSEAPTSVLTLTTAVDEVSNESTKSSLPIPDAESVPIEETPKIGNFSYSFLINFQLINGFYYSGLASTFFEK